MGKFDTEKKKMTKVQRVMIFGLILFLIGVGFIMFGSEKEKPMCSEIIEMMLDDPDHSRLHDTYPIIMMQLHVYLDDHCETVDENNPMNINP